MQEAAEQRLRAVEVRPLVGDDEHLRVVGGLLDVLLGAAVGARALVVAPACMCK